MPRACTGWARVSTGRFPVASPEAGSVGCRHGVGAQKSPWLSGSWERAKNEAGQWLADCGFGKGVDVRGEVVDLRPFEDRLKVDRLFRLMVYRAAERMLRGRGALKVVLPD